MADLSRETWVQRSEVEERDVFYSTERERKSFHVSDECDGYMLRLT